MEREAQRGEARKRPGLISCLALGSIAFPQRAGSPELISSLVSQTPGIKEEKSRSWFFNTTLKKES
jgi:hypothetical protein